MNNFEIAMKDMNAVNLMCIGFDAFDEFIYDKVKANTEYCKAEKFFMEHLDKVKAAEGFNRMDAIETSVNTIEDISKNIAFNEGFKIGVKFMQDFISKGEGFKNEKDM